MSEAAAGDSEPRGRQCATKEAGQVTGTKDKDYNIIWFTEQSLSNACVSRPTSRTRSATATASWRLLPPRAGASRQGGEQGKELLKKRLGG